jgi:DNA-binding beta-propeller fold protein YncE
MSTNRQPRRTWIIGGGLVAAVAIVGATIGYGIGAGSKAPATAGPEASAAPPVKTVVQVGELQPAPAGAVASGWETDWSKLLNARLLAQLDSSGPDAWDVSAPPDVDVTAQGPGYGSAAFGGAFPSEAQKGPGVAIIDAKTREAVASTEYLVDGVDTYPENHGLAVSPDGKWFYTQGVSSASDLSGNAVVNVINARTLKIDKVIRSRMHHGKVIHDSFTNKDLVLIEGWGTFFALDPLDDNRVVGAVDPKDLAGAGYLAFGDPSGKYLLISVRTGFQESDGGIAVVSLEDWKVKARINTLDGSPIWVAFSADGKTAYVSDGHDSKIAKLDISAENPSEWALVGLANAGTVGPYGLTLSWDDKMIFSIGKGEASHNQGKTMGFTSPDLFVSPDKYRGWGTTMGELVTNCLRGDHAIVNPDPELNEMWISCNSSFDNVIVDMGTQTVKATIPQPNGGSSHNGAFVRYAPDWTGELLSDTNGFHGSAVEVRLAIVAKATASQ